MAKTRRSKRKKRAPIDKETSKGRWNTAGLEKQNLWLQKEHPCVLEDSGPSASTTTTTTTTTTTSTKAQTLYHGYTIEQYKDAVNKMRKKTKLPRDPRPCFPKSLNSIPPIEKGFFDPRSKWTPPKEDPTRPPKDPWGWKSSLSNSPFLVPSGCFKKKK